MKQRLISAGVGLIILAIVLFCYDTIVLNIVISAISTIAVHEVLLATKCTQHKVLTGICLLFAASVPFFKLLIAFKFIAMGCLIFVLTLFLILLRQHESLKIGEVGMAFMVSICIPFSFLSLVNIRDALQNTTLGIFCLILTLAAAWVSDSGAYFVGRAWGKRKLAPKISPKKTVEGAIGGLVTCTVFFVLFGLLYTYLCGALFDIKVAVNYPMLLLLAPIGSLLSIVGDLSASIIKRQCGIKDFGTIMPGHGGIMDRFDSILFVSPMFYVAVQYLTLIRLA
ncbi:phosphatidate cytidylyltransferase [Zongyangia hominis]|uniref:Phosphatidate cytidylyltransferase n=1 Tax=Zongyangia hominis TaxID=2763677 RepID=A0A926E9K2_9FIRM|nr:phosphatidate cytidylyltransferase [Zongyangia hominis]MBC8569713.1 phosphatidate cytidylyltransferase [Zongyangia hominis]